MKYIAKMMLALLASVTLVIPAYAWDFSAGGTMQAQFNSTTTVPSTGANTQTSGGVSSEGSGLTLKSSNTDGDHSATFSYTADWDGNLDETIKVAGSKKAGKWTGSADVSYNIGAGAQTGEDTGAVTVTDGTLTIKLGDAGHLPGQNVSSSSVAGGSVSMDGADDDLGVGAFVDGFHGVSAGYKMSDTMSITVAYQSSGDANDLLGAQEFMDNETAAYGTSGFGAAVSLAAGPATIGATFGNASTKDNSGAGGSKKTTHSVLGVGVKLDLGDIDPFISFGSNSSKGTESALEAKNGGFDVGLKMAMGSDSIVAYFGSITEGDASAEETTTGLEIGYNTTVGPSSLGIGYGSKSNSDSGYTYSDIEVQMKMSF